MVRHGFCSTSYTVNEYIYCLNLLELFPPDARRVILYPKEYDMTLCCTLLSQRKYEVQTIKLFLLFFRTEYHKAMPSVYQSRFMLVPYSKALLNIAKSFIHCSYSKSMVRYFKFFSLLTHRERIGQ